MNKLTLIKVMAIFAVLTGITGSAQAATYYVRTDGGTSSQCTGLVEDGELCDGDNLNGQSCATFGFNSGTLNCTSSCQTSIAGCKNALNKNRLF